MEKRTDNIIAWIKGLFESTGGKTAIIGISGGKDSTVCGKLLVEALGKENVIGVLMPNGVQKDIADSHRVIDLLGIKSVTVNICQPYAAMMAELDGAVKNAGESLAVYGNRGIETNLPARLRMCTLYSIAAMYPSARVCNTCNRSEDYVGYSTKFGDGAGDFSPLSDLTVREVLELGDDLGLPRDLVHKTPSDGMCGKSDEDNLGFSYAQLDSYILDGVDLPKDTRDAIERKHTQNLHKLLPMPKYEKADYVE